MRVPVLIAMLVVLGSCVHANETRPPLLMLDELLAFSDQCHAEPAFAQLLESLLSVDANGQVHTGAPTVPAAFRSALGKVRVMRPLGDGENLWRVEVDLSGYWRGLRLSRLTHELVPESDVQGFTLHFAEPPEKVAKELRAISIPVRIGEVVDIADDGMSISASLLRDGAGSLFDCGT